MVIAGGSVNTNARTEGEMFAEGATVTVVQGGVSREATTNVGGVATFGDLRIGEAVITVQAPDHTTVTYTTSLGDPSFDTQQDNVETTVPLFPTTVAAGASEVSGVAWAELNLLNDMPEFAEGAIVRATVSVAGALNAYGVNFGGSSKGEIRTASYSDLVVTDTVDAQGRYSLIIPNGNADNGNGIPIDVEFLPFEAQQTYAAFEGDTVAIVTRDVIFGSDASDGEHIDNDIPSMFIEIGAPTGSASGFALTTEPQRTSLSFYSFYELDIRGSGYEVGDRFNFSDDPDEVAAYIEVDDVNDDGAITDWFLVNTGAEYCTAPSVSQDGDASGSGASFIFLFRTVYDVMISNEGTGYWDIPEVRVSTTEEENGILVEDAFDLEISFDTELLAGKIKDDSGDETDNIITTVTSSSTPQITVIPLERRQATIPFDQFGVNEDGEFGFGNDGSDIDFDFDDDDEGIDAGAGYLTSPTIIIKSIGENMGSGATITANVEDGEIVELFITNPGSGYLSDLNDTEEPDVETVDQFSQLDGDSEPTLKPASSNPNYNFYYDTGAIKQ
ncbi:MAG: carboxypeptidase-like regulatory domain-containing protein [Cyclobacteriaceae bacterium]